MSVTYENWKMSWDRRFLLTQRKHFGGLNDAETEELMQLDAEMAHYTGHPTYVPVAVNPATHARVYTDEEQDAMQKSEMRFCYNCQSHGYCSCGYLAKREDSLVHDFAAVANVATDKEWHEIEKRRDELTRRNYTEAKPLSDAEYAELAELHRVSNAVYRGEIKLEDAVPISIPSEESRNAFLTWFEEKATQDYLDGLYGDRGDLHSMAEMGWNAAIEFTQKRGTK